MSFLSKRNAVFIIGILVIILAYGVSQRRPPQPEQPEGETGLDELTGDQPVDLDSLSQEDLDELKEALEKLEFEDLGGLSEEDSSTDDQSGDVGAISQEDLDELREALEGLEFEDLGGLSEEDQSS